MTVIVNVVGQRLTMATNYRFLVDGSQEFVKFKFNLDDDWKDLTVFAQFGQQEKTYNQYLDKEYCAYLPAEVQAGTCTLMLYGTKDTTRATTNYLTLNINKNRLVADASSTEISQSLYDQLVKKIDSFDPLADADKVNAKIESAVSAEMAEYLSSGKLAGMSIGDGSVAESKLDTDLQGKIDGAMQTSVYDTGGAKIDIFEYAKGQADAVQANVTALQNEVTDAYVISGKGTENEVKGSTLGESIRTLLQTAEQYTDTEVAKNKGFAIKIVSTLPAEGEENTFYLIPNADGTKYDKYWWVKKADDSHTWDSFGSSSTVIVTTLPETGDADVDYILNSDGLCKYYKYIDGKWCLIGGGVSKEVTELPDAKDGIGGVDYYLTSADGKCTHYRLVNGAWAVVGGDLYSKSEIDAKETALKDSISKDEESIKSLQTDNTSLKSSADANTANISSLNQTVDKLRTDLTNVSSNITHPEYTETIAKNDDDKYVLTLYKDDEAVSTNILPATGGGGSTTSTTLKVDRITASPLVLTPSDKAIVKIDFSSVDSSGATVDANYTWKLNGTTILSGALVQGENDFDLTNYVNVGTQKLYLTVVDDGGSSVIRSWTIQIVDVRLESNFSDKYSVNVGQTANFTYTPYGAVQKTVHFKLDGVETTTTTTASGTLQNYVIPAQTYGSHLLEVWITAEINKSTIETKHIYKDIIWYDENRTEAVIGCIYRNDYYGTLTVRQYDTTPIVYNVYDPTTNSPVVKLYEDDVLVSTNTLTESQNTWNYSSSKIGSHTLKIVCRNTTVTIAVNVAELGIDVAPITDNLELDFNPTGITNASADRVWSNEKYQMTVSDNFDWANGGYKTDENGDSYFLIKAGTNVSINYDMFKGDISSNPSTTGAELKLIFMTENVQDANAVWFSNVESSETNGVTTNMGIQMGVHEGWLKTNTASNTNTSSGVAATNTYLYMPYSEEDIIELDINIDALDRSDSTSKAFVMSYEDGVPMKAFVYDANDRFYQYEPQPIKIGSDSCDVRIYRLKAYSASLTTENIMKNFIADARSSSVMLERYDRNSIYYNNETNKYTPYSGEGTLSPERLATKIPNVKVLMLETDYFTTSKKTFVKSNLRCIHAPGGDLYRGDEYYDNWYYENGWSSGQGTTSDNYGNAGRNVDFLFNCDGVHKPSNKVDAEAGYVSKLTLGYNTENAHTETCTDWEGDSAKVTLTRNSVPNNFFNLKVNIASSENVNNALFQKRYNDFLPYISPAKKRNKNIKNDMEFVPAVLFIKETNPDLSKHTEFKDNEWHFYALGNLGDSKKTDYTRAYDPQDMNEFTIEISDNTKNNATFQSGVFLDSAGKRQIETFNTVTDKNGNVTYESVEKPSSYVYPITADEWNDKNMRYATLYKEGFDGDHSFEPRYACCGDHRDGKLVNKTHDTDDAQLAKNEDVWRAFYRWVITSTDEEFKSELDEWCVRSAVEFFYAFTSRYTMIDNRAKNTFWHFAKTGTYRKMTKPVKELLHVYCEATTVDGTTTYTPTTDTEIDPAKTYYSQYAFDLWVYDTDTAEGNNNNGELVFPYGKEDTDYNIEGQPSSGYVFNGATSAFWCRLRDLCGAEITNTFQTVDASCFSAKNLINEFDNFQSCYPEEIWRLDIQRKYIRTFTGQSVDNSIEKHDVQYLRDMMQGKKKYQRRQWERSQELYFGTKELMNSVVGDDNRIIFRCYTPTGSDVVVEPNYTLRITPYQDMYVSVMFGNGDTVQIRSKAGQEVQVDCPLSTMDDTQVTIYGANGISGLNDLSACYIAANNFSMATRLKKLVIGSPVEGYSNPRLVSLTLGTNKMLEELDIRNCANLTGSLNLAECSNLLKLYAEGTSITGVTFATNGKVQLAHLPDTINTLVMRNLNDLDDFKCTLDNLKTLTLESGKIDSLATITNTIDTLQTLYLYNINWTLGDTSLLNKILKLFYSLLTGKVYISGQIRNQEILNYSNKWHDLKVNYDPANLVTQYVATFVNADGKKLFEEYVDRGSVPTDPVVSGELTTPTLKADAEYTYTYNGWDDVTSVMTENRTITATYAKTKRSYTVTWYSRAGVTLGSTTAEYGSEVVYNGDIPTNTNGEASLTYNVFTGWDKSTGYITGDTDVYAVWDTASLPDTSTELKDMSIAQIYGVATAGKGSEYFEDKDYFDMTMGQDFTFSNVESKVICENKFFDGKTAETTNIKLFDASAPDFTLAIEFEFLSDNTAGATLLSCFEEDGSEGFRLRYTTQPNIQWGDVDQNVGYKGNRNICVLRHLKGSNSLYVYTFNTGNDAYDMESSFVELARNRSTSTENVLTLGAVRYIGDGGFDYYGKGWIYWAKIWYADLGDNIAKKLASWTHEPIRMEFAGENRYRLSGNTSKRANLSFFANNELALSARMNDTDTNSGGWDKAEMPTKFLNKRLYDGLADKYKAVIKKVKVGASAGNGSKEIINTEQYIYVPCNREVGGYTTDPYINEGTAISYYTTNQSRMKYRGTIIKEDAQIITETTDPTSMTKYTVKDGDVWIKDSIGHCYVSADTLAKHSRFGNIEPSGYNNITASDGGLWVSAQDWWQRSPYLDGETYYWTVSKYGNPYNVTPASSNAGVVIGFSI